MSQPVNFANLGAITGGDPIMETELFRLFMESADLCFNQMQAAMLSGDGITWKKQAHAFKGVCFNLGASALGLMCQKAQQNAHASSLEKDEMLSAIQAELQRVRRALEIRHQRH